MAPKRSNPRGSTEQKASHTESTEASQRHYTLGSLAQRFVEEMQKPKYKDEQGKQVIDLSVAAEQLQVQKRRLYDITGVLEALGTISKCQQNKFRLEQGLPSQHASGNEGTLDDGGRYQLQQKIQEAEMTSNYLSELTKKTSTDLHTLSNQVSEDPYGWLTNRDIRELSCFDDHTLIAVRAPPGVTLEVPETKRTDNGEEYQLHMHSDRGPIQTFLVEQGTAEEEHNEEKCSQDNETVPSSRSAAAASNKREREHTRSGFREICPEELEDATSNVNQDIPQFAQQMQNISAATTRNGQKRVRRLSIEDLYNDDAHIEYIDPVS